MIRITQVKMLPGHSMEELKQKASRILGITEKDISHMEIARRSVDARKRPNIYYSYSLYIVTPKEKSVLQRFGDKDERICKMEPVEYRFPASGSTPQKHPAVIVGTGPAGLFCGYYLALHGYRPILLERGRDVDTRQADVEAFWNGGPLNPASNVQFGEGGAGTFSDGKLNTLIKDKEGRNLEVLKTFVRFGAGESILYEAKPHVGTDVLCSIVKNMRQEIIRLGGEVRFQSQMTDILIRNNKVTGIVINEEEKLACEQLVLAVGHSARDTFSMLYERKVPMEAKSFAVGLRVQHPQELINESQYGMTDPGILGAAEYKSTAQTYLGRGVYTFCMCPGGYVVNASSEEGRLATNGMSYSGRDGKNANSAVIVTVTPEDYGDTHPLAGIEFQRKLEERAYQLCGGKIPAQRYGVFAECVTMNVPEEMLTAEDLGCTVSEMNAEESLQPECKGEFQWADVSRILPRDCNKAFVLGMEKFGRKIEGFDRKDTILLGVESRTSSPVRIHRDETLQSEIRGLYPCGEGAGYAGGIASAAMDGLRAAEEIVRSFAPLQDPEENP